MEPVNAIRRLFPSFNDAELAEAEDDLREHLILVLRIYERICADPEAYARFRALTASDEYRTIKRIRSDSVEVEPT